MGRVIAAWGARDLVPACVSRCSWGPPLVLFNKKEKSKKEYDSKHQTPYPLFAFPGSSQGRDHGRDTGYGPTEFLRYAPRDSTGNHGHTTTKVLRFPSPEEHLVW